MTKPRILVVDDNPANLELMLYLLRSFDYDAQGCSDGIAGLNAARTARYAMVLTDILMPGIDGYEFAREFKSDTALQSTPLIAVTALAMPADRERIAAAGFDGYIRKPIEPRTFLTQLQAFFPRAQG
ncbi:MAG: response regulator [Candidatus Eremiobacteraeota bacterium]|nr:response regulator [Candidatus Eremiobacteraeota bacterium]